MASISLPCAQPVSTPAVLSMDSCFVVFSSMAQPSRFQGPILLGLSRHGGRVGESGERVLELVVLALR